VLDRWEEVMHGEVGITNIREEFLHAVADLDGIAEMQTVSLAVWGDAVALQATWGPYAPVDIRGVSRSHSARQPLCAYSVDASALVGRQQEILTIPIVFGWESRGRLVSDANLRWLAYLDALWPNAQKIIVPCAVAPCTVLRDVSGASIGPPEAIMASGLFLNQLLDLRGARGGKTQPASISKEDWDRDGDTAETKTGKPILRRFSVRIDSGVPIDAFMIQVLANMEGSSS